LLIIALSYNILSAEREGGTQALLLSQPVSLKQFVLGKILLRGAVIVGVATVLSLIGVLVTSPDVLGSGGLWRIGLWLLMIVAYGAFWFGLAVVVNAFANKSSTNAMILMGSWLTLVLIVPAVLNLIAKATYPLPSRVELVQTMRRADAVAQKEEAEQLGDAAATDLSSRQGEEAVVTSINNFNKRVLPLEQRGEAIAEPIFARFESQRASQQSFVERLKYLSPAIVSQAGIAQIADNSTAAFGAFEKQVKDYHQKWRDYFYPRVMADHMLTRQEMGELPRFRYVPEADSTVFLRSISDLICLAAFAGAVLLLGLARLKRYPVAAR
jgi:ABC-2 type transport system permease protein